MPSQVRILPPVPSLTPHPKGCGVKLGICGYAFELSNLFALAKVAKFGGANETKESTESSFFRE